MAHFADTSQHQITLHIGAHKTASTHLQQSLRAAMRPLAQAGVRYFGPDSLRKLGQTLPERFGFPFDPKNASPDADPALQLRRMIGDGHRLTLSEENFAGNFQRGWGKVPLPLYPAAADRVTRLAQAVGQKVDLCVAVRHPSDFLASIYSQVLLSGKTVTPEEFLVRNMPSNVDWSDYVAQLRKAEGVGSLTVWCYEDYSRLFPQIVAAMVGQEAADIVTPVNHRTMPRLSMAAVGEAISQRVLQDKKIPVRDIAERLPSTEENPPFELFDPDLRAIARDYYCEQVLAIGQTPGVTLLQ